jgi:hypothetical protein
MTTAAAQERAREIAQTIMLQAIRIRNRPLRLHYATETIAAALDREREEAELKGWNLAHEPARCGHARANWKDPAWGTPEYDGDEKCEACTAIAAQAARFEKIVREVKAHSQALNIRTYANVTCDEILRRLKEGA